MAQHVLSISQGKDSMACLFAIEKLGWPLDRIIHAEIWATDMIPADLPPMVEFKAHADQIIKSRWGIDVEHVCATKSQRERERLTYEDVFYRIRQTGKYKGQNSIYGFPVIRGPWCNDRLKMKAIKSIEQQDQTVHYVGIAADEPERLARLDGTSSISPLAAIGWTEADCFRVCEENNLLSPIYSDSTRGGCWFCHNQSIDQLRKLRKNYPDLWNLLLKWDADSPVSFHPDGHTVHDFDLRFSLEDDLRIPADRRFRWKMLNEYKEKL